MNCSSSHDEVETALTMLSRKGHCSSYDDVEAMDTSIANEIIAKSDIFGVYWHQTFPLVCLYRLQATIMT